MEQENRGTGVGLTYSLLEVVVYEKVRFYWCARMQSDYVVVEWNGTERKRARDGISQKSDFL